jgi:DNA-binding SARP family transcriptional activator/cytochrome c-type biogenesis protein CcmH/NrfG
VPKLNIRLFETLEVTSLSGEKLPIIGAKQQALLAYLAAHLEHPPARATLTNLFWGARFEDQARQSLRQAVSKLRKTLNQNGQEVLWTDAELVGLNPDLINVDLTQFESLAQSASAEDLFQAEALCSTSFLQGLNINEEAFDDWLLAERSRISGLVCNVLSKTADLRVIDGKSSEAVETVQKLISYDPLREQSYRQSMRILAQAGRRTEAIRQYNACAELLKTVLDVEPDPETKRLLQEIRAVGPSEELEDTSAPPEKAEPPTSPFFGASSASSMPAIIVLPFSQLGSQDDTSFIAEEMTEDLNTALSKYRWLSVISLGATTPGTAAVDLQELAKQQGAEYAVEGSLRKSADRLRLTANLIDLKTRKYLWVQRYDRGTDHIPQIQDELIETIAATVESELTSAEGERARHIDNKAMSAWDCYHLGLSTQYEFGKDSNAAAQNLFRRAIEMDPNFSAAYARLSYALVISTIYFEADQNSGILQEALELAKKATRMDNQDAIAQFSLGRAYLALGEYENSVVALETATKLNPTMAQAFCGLGDSLAYAGRLEESVEQFDEAVRLSPNDPYRWAFLMYGAVALLFMKNHERSLDWATQATRVPTSHYWANAVQVAALGHLGRKEEAEKARQNLLRLEPNFTCAFAKDRLFYLRLSEQRDHYIEGLKLAGVPA